MKCGMKSWRSRRPLALYSLKSKRSITRRKKRDDQQGQEVPFKARTQGAQVHKSQGEEEDLLELWLEQGWSEVLQGIIECMVGYHRKQ